MPMQRANGPSRTGQLDLFPLFFPGPDQARLPKEARETAARLMARMLEARAAGAPGGQRAGGRGDE
jgi:hypothetical protein